MAKGSKFYVVWKGLKPGVYKTWDECKVQVEGYFGAQFKAFANQEQAEQAFQGNFKDFIEPKVKKKVIYSNKSIIHESICVDAACSGNPGIMEYRGVDMKTGKEIFKRGPYPEGTNNIGEFLAIVHGIAYLTKANLKKVIYTDSATAISWIKQQKVKTKLERNQKNSELFTIISRAENYLRNTPHNIELIKWETEEWGEIPADFGRK